MGGRQRAGSVQAPSRAALGDVPVKSGRLYLHQQARQQQADPSCKAHGWLDLEPLSMLHGHRAKL